MNKTAHFLRLLFLAAALICAGACTKYVDLNVAALPNVNPDQSGRPSPVVLRAYELKNDVAFGNADFNSIFHDHARVMPVDILSIKEIICVPGSNYSYEYKKNDDTHYIGIIAGFRHMERAVWKMIVPAEDRKITINLELNDTLIRPVDDSWWNPEKAQKEYKNRMSNIDIGQEPPGMIRTPAPQDGIPEPNPIDWLKPGKFPR